jgi:hypothetical protein
VGEFGLISIELQPLRIDAHIGECGVKDVRPGCPGLVLGGGTRCARTQNRWAVQRQEWRLR